MRYTIEISPRARKDIRKLDLRVTDRILLKIDEMAKDLAGDVKHLTQSEPEYRLRVNDFRVLFDLEGRKIIVRRIKNRREAY